MKNGITEDELWDLIGFIKISSARFKTIMTLQNEHLMPKEIIKRTDLKCDEYYNDGKNV